MNPGPDTRTRSIRERFAAKRLVSESAARMACFAPGVIAAGILFACEPYPRCGPGTVLVDGFCVVAAADAAAREDSGSAPSTADSGGGMPADASVPGASDASELDAPAITCGARDRSVCEGNAILDCATGGRTGCGLDACLMLSRSGGAYEAFCGPAGASPCEYTTFVPRCEGNLLRECLLRSMAGGPPLPSWEVETDCGDAPDGACVSSPAPHCESPACDPSSFVGACTADRTQFTVCERDRLRYHRCADGSSCRADRTRPGPVCVPDSAIESEHGSRVDEVIGCASSTEAIVQRYGYEWRMRCENDVVRVGEGFVSVPTTCVEREGSFGCLTAAEYRPTCTGSGWSCTTGGPDAATYCEGGRLESYRCVVACDGATGRCVLPTRCDPGAPAAGECIDRIRGTTCVDLDGDETGWIETVSCPNQCSESPSFVCR